MCACVREEQSCNGCQSGTKKKKRDINVIECDEPGGCVTSARDPFGSKSQMPGNGSALSLFQLSVDGTRSDLEVSPVAVLVHAAVLI